MPSEGAVAAGCSEDEVLLASALAAIRCWAEGKVELPELADVAAVNAGLYPAYTGGPFNHVRQSGLDTLRERTDQAASKTRDQFEWLHAVDRFINHAPAAA